MLIISLVFALVFLFIGSCENSTPITSPNQQSLESIDQQLDELEEGVAELSKSVLNSNGNTQNTSGDESRWGRCCNNLFPPAPVVYENMVHSLRVCSNDPDEIHISGTECAKTWAKYNHNPGVSLGWQACGEDVPWVSIPNISGLTKSQSGNNPYFTWNFMYCHYYRIERKIGNGNWAYLAQNANCNEGRTGACGSNNSKKYIDSSINLNTITQNIYYRVLGNIYGNYSSGGTEIMYTPPAVTVNISGPTNLLSGQSGTFTANVGGGVPPYTYSWQKYQYCNDKSQSNDTDEDDGTRSVPCGYWRPTGTNFSIVYVSGYIPAFKLKVTVTDQNSSATDYHYVNVSLP